jgi:hypothetical protein
LKLFDWFSFHSRYQIKKKKKSRRFFAHFIINSTLLLKIIRQLCQAITMCNTRAFILVKINSQSTNNSHAHYNFPNACKMISCCSRKFYSITRNFALQQAFIVMQVEINMKFLRRKLKNIFHFAVLCLFLGSETRKKIQHQTLPQFISLSSENYDLTQKH